jgi:hypothetical protein
MRRHLPLIFALLFMACHDAPTSPSAILQPSAGPPFTMRGEVMDTTNLPISGAQVQVVTGPRAGAITETDEDGQFVLPWTLSATATVRVSKEGFHALERQVPAPGSPRFAGQIVNGDFPYGSLFFAEVRGRPTRTIRIQTGSGPYTNPAIGLVERLGPEMFLEVTGSSELQLGTLSATAAFDATFAFCAAEPGSPDVAAYRCPVPPTTCRSANHRLAWTR